MTPPSRGPRETFGSSIDWTGAQFTLGFLVWSFVLVSIMLTYDTSAGFVAFIALAQLLNFVTLGRCACANSLHIGSDRPTAKHL